MYNCRKYHNDSIEPINVLAQQLEGRIEFVRGAELGQPLQAVEIADEILSDKELDFVIGSLHNNAGLPDFYYLQYDKMTAAEITKLLDDYFAQLLEMCEWGRFDILGHITYPLRYITGKYSISIDLNRYKDICAQIFKTLIGKGKGIEINTSGLFTDYKTTMPDRSLLALYKDLGGEVLSLGSDAHCAEKIGQGIDIGAQLAKDCGFKYCTFFKRHKPEFVRL
jgi:histidinol-phosphatase (PHP family)